MNKNSISFLQNLFIFSFFVSQTISFPNQLFQNSRVPFRLSSHNQANNDNDLFKIDFNDITKDDLEKLGSLIGIKFIQILNQFEYNLMTQSGFLRNLTLTDLSSISNPFISNDIRENGKFV
jgi:hypothetical protein